MVDVKSNCFLFKSYHVYSIEVNILETESPFWGQNWLNNTEIILTDNFSMLRGGTTFKTHYSLSKSTHVTYYGEQWM